MSSPVLPEKLHATTKALPPFNLPCTLAPTKRPEAVILLHFAEDERTLNRFHFLSPRSCFLLSFNCQTVVMKL